MSSEELLKAELLQHNDKRRLRGSLTKGVHTSKDSKLRALQQHNFGDKWVSIREREREREREGERERERGRERIQACDGVDNLVRAVAYIIPWFCRHLSIATACGVRLPRCCLLRNVLREAGSSFIQVATIGN